MLNLDEILDDHMVNSGNDSGIMTLREYLHALLATLWAEQDDFSGKRPFGNSDWTDEIYMHLINKGLVVGSIIDYGDESYEIDDCNYQEADHFVGTLIHHIFHN